MMKRLVVVCLVVVVALLGFIGVALTLPALDTAPLPPSVEVIAVTEGGVVISPDSVWFDGVYLNQTITSTGVSGLWVPVLITGTHQVTDTASVFTLEVFDLSTPGQVYTDTNGVWIAVNEYVWGRTQIVEYLEMPDYTFYSVTGLGYQSWWPEGTYFRQSDGGYSTYPYYEDVTRVLVPNAVVEPPGPTPTPTSTIGSNIYLPVIMVPPPPPLCLSRMPALPISWQSEFQHMRCEEFPLVYEGISPVFEDLLYHNVTYPGLVGPGSYVLQTGDVYDDGAIFVRANNTSVGLVEICSNCGIYQYKVYSLYGTGYDFWTPADVLYWNWSTKVWQSDPIWGLYTLIAVP